MTTEISIIGFKEVSTITLNSCRFNSGSKLELAAALCEAFHPSKNTTPSFIADQIGKIVDKGSTTSIESPSILFLDGKSYARTFSRPLILQQGQETSMAITGFSHRDLQHAVLKIRHL